MKLERLIFKGVSEIVGNEGLGLLLLTDEAGQRQITIMCDKAMALQLHLRVRQDGSSDTLLPEVLCSFIKAESSIKMEIMIYAIYDGQYRAIVYNRETRFTRHIRACDAVLLSIIGDIPLYIDSLLMERQSVKYVANQTGVALPVNTLNREMLDKALNQAIEEENYELASELRDEKRRRWNGHTNNEDRA